MVKYGAKVLGGCCGTTPAYVAKLKEMVATDKRKCCEKETKTACSMYTFKDCSC